ncbi:MAG: hypothetical protein CME64_04905 [Halobacteriovoraceae bacterium]|nr:hypothetical protein [Halobacteriovoraceae bacterium]|tara:strand:+ start:357538 stop:358263 length:726 start_codon:yes stop_codon:yes gene_type:complete
MKRMKSIVIAALLGAKVFAGVGEGGGHPLETAVKERIKDVVTEIEYMSEDAKELLNFNYLSLAMVVELDMNVLCASDEQMKTLKYHNKLAWVFKENSREIRVDCSVEKKNEWNEKLNSISYVDDIFFLHEALRSQNILDDDNYVYSSTYAAAYKKNMADESRALFRLMRTRNNGCKVKIYTDDKGGLAELSVRGVKVNAYRFDGSTDLVSVENNFLNAATDEAKLTRKKIVLRAQENYCLN